MGDVCWLFLFPRGATAPLAQWPLSFDPFSYLRSTPETGELFFRLPFNVSRKFVGATGVACFTRDTCGIDLRHAGRAFSRRVAVIVERG